jgi:hypothetical protein
MAAECAALFSFMANNSVFSKTKNRYHEEYERNAAARMGRKNNEYLYFFIFHACAYILLILLILSNIYKLNQYVINHELKEGSALSGFSVMVEAFL